MWGYHSYNAAFSSRAEMLNKTARAWYLKRRVDRSVKGALEWSAATGRGWMRPVYRRNMYGTGQGDIYLDVYGAPSVLPVQLPSSGDWQEAYVVTILDEMPVAKAHSMFPAFQDRLRPSSSRYWYQNDAVHRAAQGNILQRIFGQFKRDRARNDMADLLVPIRRSYVLDLSINRTTGTIPMGEPGSSWYYEVPPLGSDIPVGIDPKSGTRLFRKADENDARLYPRRRLVLSTPDLVLYDGPAFDWHGMFPGVSFALDSYPWEPAGFSLIHDGFDINEALKEIYRGGMDKIRQQLRPSLAYDTNAVAMSEARAFDPMQPDARVGYDGSSIEGQPFRPVLDAEATRLDPVALEFAKMLEASLDSQMAISDLMALAKARAAGSMDDVEKIMEANGPIVEDMSRSMEAPMAELGSMVKYNFLQYYSTPRVMQIVGPDGMAMETFDYDPAKLIPSHVPGENPEEPSALSPAERARILADNLEFYILPDTLHELTQMAMKLGLVQLRKAQVMIDSQTIAEAWQVPNYGHIDGNTVIERWQREQEMQLEQAAKMKAVAEGLGLVSPAGPPGQKAQEGRPPSGKAAPQIVPKDGGARSTISESGR
jgi:hypothetical protein